MKKRVLYAFFISLFFLHASLFCADEGYAESKSCDAEEGDYYEDLKRRLEAGDPIDYEAELSTLREGFHKKNGREVTVFADIVLKYSGLPEDQLAPLAWARKTECDCWLLRGLFYHYGYGGIDIDKKEAIVSYATSFFETKSARGLQYLVTINPKNCCYRVRYGRSGGLFRLKIGADYPTHEERGRLLFEGEKIVAIFSVPIINDPDSRMQRYLVAMTGPYASLEEYEATTSQHR